MVVCIPFFLFFILTPGILMNAFAPIDTLPNELKLKIFLYARGKKNFEAMSCVCKQWFTFIAFHRTTFLNELKSKKFLYSYQQAEYDAKLDLKIMAAKPWTREQLCALIETHPYTQSINLDGNYVGDLEKQAFSCIGLNFHSLRELRLIDNFGGGLNIADSGLLTIVSHNPKLRCLKIHGCCNLTPQGLIAASKLAKKLKECYLASSFWLNDAVLQAFVEDHPFLTKLEQGIACQKAEYGTLTDQAAETIAQKGQNLKKWWLYQSYFTQLVLMNTLSKLSHLQSLLLRTKEITDEEIETMASCLPLLNDCDLSKWRVGQLSTIRAFAKCPLLETLTIQIYNQKKGLFSDLRSSLVSQVKKLKKECFPRLKTFSTYLSEVKFKNRA